MRRETGKVQAQVKKAQGKSSRISLSSSGPNTSLPWARSVPWSGHPAPKPGLHGPFLLLVTKAPLRRGQHYFLPCSHCLQAPASQHPPSMLASTHSKPLYLWPGHPLPLYPCPATFRDGRRWLPMAWHGTARHIPAFKSRFWGLSRGWHAPGSTLCLQASLYPAPTWKMKLLQSI